MTTARWRVMALLAAALASPSVAAAQQLVPATEPRLVNCNEKPCFRMTLNGADSAGRPTVIDTQSSERFRITDGVAPYPVFHVSAVGEAAVTRGAYWMLLLDLSGSMLTRLGTGTRFDAAREAIRGAIGDLREGQDHFALVPFESHRVREGVAAAQFVTSRAEALARLSAIAPPPVSNNTALYSAAFDALDVLRRYEQQGNDVSLVVFTDGKNDVRPETGDDRGLLGNEGLELVRQKAREYNIQVKTIGFGARGDRNFDEVALRQLAFPDDRQYSYAANAEAVRGILSSNAKALANRVVVTFGPVAETKGQLRGRTISFTVAATSNGQPIATAAPVFWSAPAIQEPSFSDGLTPIEQRAFDVKNGPDLDNPNRWVPRLIALGIFGAVLSIGWFGLPRMLWPERYIPKPNFPVLEGRSGAVSQVRNAMPRAESRPRAPAAPAHHAPRADDPPSASVVRPPPRVAPPRRPPPPRDVGDSTVYIPRGKKFEKDS